MKVPPGHVMENDCIYTMGQSHRVCQDYARTGPRFALVSDGCSGSADSDLGARFLVSAAARLLQESGCLDQMSWIARRAERAASFLGASRYCLDATLLCAWVEQSGALIMRAAGDGVLAVRMRSGQLFSWHIDDGAAPAYLSYSLCEQRLGEYFAAGFEHRLVHTRCDGQLIASERHALEADFVYERRLDMKDVEAVYLFSDGVSSFVDAGGNPVDAGEVLAELCAIKGYKGAFVQRRVRRFLSKLCIERGWRHHDDLTMAALYGGDVEAGATR